MFLDSAMTVDQFLQIMTWGYTNITGLVNNAILPNPFLWVPLLAFFIIGGIIGLTMRLMGR